MSDEDFLPHAKRWPGEAQYKCCVGYSLSMFESRLQAIARYNELMRTTRGKFAKRSGTHLATGSVAASHGVSTQPCSKTGHFSFFAFDGVSLKGLFQISEQLPTANG